MNHLGNSDSYVGKGRQRFGGSAEAEIYTPDRLGRGIRTHPNEL